MGYQYVTFKLNDSNEVLVKLLDLLLEEGVIHSYKIDGDLLKISFLRKRYF